MMALDASIYRRFAPKSVAEYDLEAENVEGARQSNALNRLRLSAGQRAETDAQRVLGEQTGVRNALSALGTGATDEQRVNALRALGTQTGLGQADALEKGYVERQSKRSAIAKTESDITTESIKRYRGALDFIDTPEGAARWLQAQYTDPALAKHMQSLGTIEQAVQRIPTDPQGFQQWRQRAGMGMEAFEKQLAERADKAATRDLTKRGQDLTDERIRSEGAANRGVSMRGQNMVDARTRELTGVTKQAAADSKQQASNEKAVTKFSDTLQKEGIPELETAVSGAEGAISRYKEGEVPGVGPLKNAVPDALMSDEGKDVRQALAAVRNIVLSARSGAAVTDQELRRLVEEIGTGTGKTEADLRRGLKRIRERVDKIKENAAAGVSDEVLGAYQERGGIAIKRGGKSEPKPGGGFKYLGTE
jgi:hypothetical protein